PVTALPATVSGLARKTFASLWPMRPGKLRLVVLMQASGWLRRPKVSLGPPRQAAHEGWPIFAPADRKTSSSDWPFSFSLLRPAAISLVAGSRKGLMREARALGDVGGGGEKGHVPPGGGPAYGPARFLPRPRASTGAGAGR